MSKIGHGELNSFMHIRATDEFHDVENVFSQMVVSLKARHETLRQAIANLPVLAVTDDVEALTRRILATGLIPPRATRDAAHIAFASVHGMDFLLTWNCRHIHNAMISRRLSGVCAALGFTLPVLCTPRELMIK